MGAIEMGNNPTWWQIQGDQEDIMIVVTQKGDIVFYLIYSWSVT